jgi:hypothetical protein
VEEAAATEEADPGAEDPEVAVQAEEVREVVDREEAAGRQRGRGRAGAAEDTRSPGRRS